MADRKDKVWGGLFGTIVGDALGVPYEFRPPTELPELSKIEMTPPIGFDATYAGVAPGTWSDDSANALCLLESLLERGALDLTDFADRLVDWMMHGHMSVGKYTFDIGNQTRASLAEYQRTKDAEHSGLVFPEGMGNGGLMRDISLPIWHRGTDEELVYLAERQCLVTHGHPICQVCSAFYCLMARKLMELSDYSKAHSAAVESLRAIYQSVPGRLEILEEKILDGRLPVKLGGSFVIDSLKSSLKAVQETDSYEAAVRAAVSYGNDTDTTAAIAGGLAGVLYGFQAIPSRWRDQILERETPEALLARIPL